MVRLRKENEKMGRSVSGLVQENKRLSYDIQTYRSEIDDLNQQILISDSRKLASS